MAIENIGLVAVTESAAKKVALKAGGKIKAHSGTKYLLQVENSDVAPENVTVKRVGKDLQISFEGSEEPDLTITDFFEEGMDSQLYGVAEDGQLYAYVRTDGEGFGSPLLLAEGESAPIALGGDALADGAAYLASTFDDAAGFVLWPWLLGLAGVGAAAAAIIHHNRDSGGHHDTPTSPAPTNIKAIDDVGPIQGELHNGDITDDSHPEISGNGVPGAIIHIFDNGQEIGSTTVAGDGTWSFTPEFADGAHNIDITQEIPGQKPSAPVNVVDIVVDTTAPAAPTAEIEGAKTDGEHTYSNDDTPTIHGNGEPGDTIIIVFPTGESVTTVVAEDGTWVAPQPTQPLPEGNNDIKVIEQDPAGNQTEIIVPVIIDTVAPAAPEVHLDPDSDTGIKGDDITSDTKPTIDGKTEPGADVTVIFPNGEEIHTKADDNGDWSVTPTQPLPEGNNDITVIATDPAGNQSEPTVISVVIDTTAPTAPEAHLDPESDSGIKGDNITNDTTPTIDGKTEPGADTSALGVVITHVIDDVGSVTGDIAPNGVTDDVRPEIQGTSKPGSIVKLYDGSVELGSVTADAKGNWSFTPASDLAEGPHNIAAIATDKAGNTSDPAKFAFTVDTTAPTKPTIDSVYDDVGSIQGPIENGGVTDDSTPTLSGKAEAGSTVVVYDNGQKLGSVVADADGKWSYTPTTPISEGQHDFTVDATDKAGNTSPKSDVFTIITDYTAPDADKLAITGVEDSVGTITGNIANGGTTDDPRPVIHGTGTAGDIVTVYTQDSTGNHKITPTADLAEGLHNISATATDKAGVVSDPAKFAFTVDTTAPTKPTIDQVYDDVGSIQGPIANGGVTDDSTPTLSGKAEAGSTVVVYDNGDKLGSTTADKDGKWSFTPTTPISEGQHDFTVDATDKAGNTSPKSDVFTVITDYTAPDASKLAITGVEDHVGTITGNIANGGTTDDPRPVIHGTGTAGDIVTVYTQDSTGNHKIGSAVVDADGNWSMKPELPLVTGLNDLTAIESDPAGNATAPTDKYSITFDASAPQAPVIVSVYDDVGPYQGFLQKGDVTDDNKPTIAGTAQAGSVVRLYDNNDVLIGSTTADAKGNWSITPETALADGKHEVYATATNAVGVVSDPTGKWDFSVDTGKPSNVSDLVVTDNVGEVTGPLHDGDTTDDNRPTFSGDAEPNGKVIIYDNGAKIGEADVGTDGKWEFKPTTPLDDGKHDFTTEVLDKAGNSSGQGDKLDVIVDTSGVGVAITHVIDDVGSITGDITSGGVTDDKRPEIQGTSKPGSIVKLYDGSVELGSTTVDSKGNWTFTPTADLADGAHSIQAIATDKAGKVSDPAKFDFTVDTTAPAKPTIDQVYDDVGSIQGPVANGGVTDDSTPTLSGKAEAGSIVVIYDNGAKLGSTTAGSDGKWSYTPTTPLSEGEQKFTVDATDKAGNTSPKSDVFTIITDYSGPTSDSTQLSIDNVTSDNTVNNAESQGNVTISGKVTGEFTAGDKVSFKLDGTTYSATVKADGTWSVDVPGSKLVDDAAHKIDATLVAHDAAGNAGTITASHGYSVMLNSVSITSMSKDSGIDPAHASDFITADGSAGRGVYGKIDQTLLASQKVQVSFDGGVTWKDAATNGLNWTAVDTGSHTASWTIQARIVDNGVSQAEASKAVTFLGSAGAAPTITNIPDADGVYTTAKASDGADVNVSLAGTNAKAGDTLHIIWGDTTYDQVLTATDITAGELTVSVPKEQTTTQGGQWDFTVTAQIVTPEGQIGKPSDAFQVRSEGWTTLAIDDLNRNVGTSQNGAPIYQGGGVTVTSNSTSLAHFAGDASGNAGLSIDNPSVGDTSVYAQINFTQPVSEFSINISNLQNTYGGSHVVIYDTSGNVLYDQMVKADGSGGNANSKAFSFAAPVGVDIGKAMIYGDGAGSLANAGGLTLDTLKFKQVQHAPGYNDTFSNEVGKTTTGAGYHSDEGHFTLTSQGAVSVRSAAEHNLDGPYLYIGSGTSAMNNSAAIFTFDQPVQSIAYNLWGLETQQAIAGNYSKLEVYDTSGTLIFTRNVTNNGGSTYNYEQVSYTAPEGISIGQVKVYQDANGTLLDNFTTVLAPSAPSGQKLIDHSWETFFDEASVTKAVSWQAQSFANTAFKDGTTLAGYHSTGGGFTVSGAATKSPALSVWENAKQGSMFVDSAKTAVVTFDTARSKVEVGVTGIEKGNTAILKVFGTDGSLLDTINMTNPTGTYDILSYSYEANGNSIGRIEVTGDTGGTCVTSISSSVTQVTTESDVISMVVDPVAYFAQDSAHIFGSSGMDTLKLTGANQVLDLTKLTGDSDAAKISSIEKFDITGTGNNTLKISLNDVLHLGETDMFRKDGKVQVMVDGDAGDQVQLANLHDHGTAPGTWQAAGTTSIGGSTYQVYSYSNLDAEVLIKQAVTASIV